MGVRGSRQRDIEERWGVPFWNLVEDLHGQGLNQRDAGRALGYETWNQYIAFRQVLERSGDRNPWQHCLSVPAQYGVDTGESFRAACERLAKTHTITQAAIAVGYADVGPFVSAMRARGISVQFRTMRELAQA